MGAGNLRKYALLSLPLVESLGGAIGSTSGPIGTASGAIAGSAFGEYIWQSVMED